MKRDTYGLTLWRGSLRHRHQDLIARHPNRIALKAIEARAARDSSGLHVEVGIVPGAGHLVAVEDALVQLGAC